MKNYFTGGLAETVFQPSSLTYELLSKWFTGAESVGAAMRLLGLPYVSLRGALLAMEASELVVDLRVEAATLYQPTILTYAQQKNIHDLPRLVIDWRKIWNPSKWWGTLQLTLQQGNWIANPAAMVATAKGWVAEIPQQNLSVQSAELIKILGEQVWPKVIATDFLCEFYAHFLNAELKEKSAEALTMISAQVAERDWFFQSLAKQFTVKSGQLTLQKYLAEFGMRADKDYELTSPRWSEIPDKIAARIAALPNQPAAQPVAFSLQSLTPTQQKLVTAVVELQVLRSEAKRKCLVVFQQLRQALGPNAIRVDQASTVESAQSTTVKPHGQGIGVSTGNASGPVKNIISSDTIVEMGEIGIFPNASPEFSFLYPRCSGMIFLKGGQTSHGSIVAREYHLSALVDHQAAGLPDGTYIELDGATGEWQIVRDEQSPVKQPVQQTPTIAKNSKQKASRTETKEIADVKIWSLAKLTPAQQKLAGGKAANLAILMNIDTPVAAGFVITFAHPEAGKLSTAAAEKILTFFSKLNAKQVAVRSSALAEDGAQTSFAGQFETYLGVTKEGLITAIEKCLASASQKRVGEYAAQHHLQTGTQPIAVCVQVMVASQISGVIFTKNVLTGNTQELTIEACWGLGESIAQGEITPEQYVMNKKTGQVISQTKHAQTEKYVLTPKGTQKIPVTSAEQNAELLSSAQLKKLLALSLKIEKHFKSSQDIEWAMVKDRLFILQTRPVTT